jgi:putative transposase
MKLTYKFKHYPKKKDHTLDELCVISNDLYNQANYVVKEELRTNKKWIRYNKLDKIMRVEKNLEGEVNYYKLKAQVAQQNLKLLDKNWKSYFKSIKDCKANSKKYKGKPRPPRFRKTKDRNLLVYTNQCAQIRDNKIILDYSNNIFINIPINEEIDFESLKKFQQIRILPRRGFYEIEIIYNKDCVNFNLDQNNYLAIDLGVNNFATCISRNKAFILSGKAIKSENQYFNKMLSKYQSFQDKKGTKTCRKKLRNLSSYRSNFNKDQFHKMSRLIVNYCLTQDIGTLVVGYNELWKTSTDMGRLANQAFVFIPHKEFFKFLEYKCKLVGIVFIFNEESYTSKCDGLALESIKFHKKYLGKRVHRGLFKSSTGKTINGDVNGALDILRKVIGDGPFVKGLIGSEVLFNPVKIRCTDLVNNRVGGQTLLNFLVRC